MPLILESLKPIKLIKKCIRICIRLYLRSAVDRPYFSSKLRIMGGVIWLKCTKVLGWHWRESNKVEINDTVIKS